MIKLIRISSNFGNKGEELRLFSLLKMASAGFKPFVIESTTIKELLFCSRLFDRQKVSWMQSPKSSIFRSSSLNLTKILYIIGWGKVWFIALFASVCLSQFLIFIVKLACIYTSKNWLFSSKINRFILNQIILNTSFSRIHDFYISNIYGADIDGYIFDNPRIPIGEIKSMNSQMCEEVFSASKRVCPHISTYSSSLLNSYVRDSSKIVAINLRTNNYLANDPSIDFARVSSLKNFSYLCNTLREHQFHPIFFGSYSAEDMKVIAEIAVHISRLQLPISYDEVSLVRDSCLFIKNASGPQILSGLFKQKTLSIDLPFVHFADWETPESRYMPKYIFSKGLNRYLSPEEIFSLPVLQYDLVGGEMGLNMYYKENLLIPECLSQEHLWSAVSEMLFSTNFPRSTQADLDIQNYLARLRSNRVMDLLNQYCHGSNNEWYAFRELICEGKPSISFALSSNKPWSPSS